MKTAPIVHATVDFSSGAAPRAPAFDDIYHPASGALAQAQQVFLAGNGLPERWRGRPRFTILETGFGLGNSFLATWAAWREDPARCERLFFVSIEKHPLTRDDLARAHTPSPLPALANPLIAAWPPATCNLHSLDFDNGRVRLLLAFGDVQVWSREIVAQVDAFYLDGFAPARNPAMWERGVFTMLARVAARGATVATWSAAHAVREGLRHAGFEVHSAPGSGGKRDITLARSAPRFKAPPPPGRVQPGAAPAHAIVVGAGLAGAFTARALVRQGIACTVFDRHAEPAAEASGNPAGLFHGAVMGHDGPHARLLRAAALATAPCVSDAKRRGVAARLDGLLRLESSLSLPAMQALLDAQALPASCVRAMSATEASQLAGVRLAQPAWFYAGAGWADPAALVCDALAVEGVVWRGETSIERIAYDGQAWSLHDAAGRCIDQAPMLVLANAQDALRLAGLSPHWLQRQRGQVSWTVDARSVAPRVPVASGGYVLTLPGGQLLFGATSQADDDDALVRESDHADNRAKAALLIGDAAPQEGTALHGRVGWRAATRDRLPLVGPAPDLAAPRPARDDAPRLLPRRPGVWLHTGLGSRGLTTAALCAELVAAQASGAPWPLEADLVDAIDPARWLVSRSRAA